MMKQLLNHLVRQFLKKVKIPLLKKLLRLQHQH
jgi:hypothetical protein